VIDYIGNCVQPEDLDLLTQIDEAMKQIKWRTIRHAIGEGISRLFDDVYGNEKLTLANDYTVTFWKAKFAWCGRICIFYVVMQSGIHYVWSNDVAEL